MSLVIFIITRDDYLWKINAFHFIWKNRSAVIQRNVKPMSVSENSVTDGSLMYPISGISKILMRK